MFELSIFLRMGGGGSMHRAGVPQERGALMLTIPY